MYRREELNVFAGKPIIGIAGGVGSGKSFVARMLGEMGGVVISSDELAHKAYELAEVKATLRQWWGDEVFDADGQVNRRAVGAKVFSDESSRRRLEELIHPIVARQRAQIMEAQKNNPSALAFIWDVPLLFETDLNRQCDAVLFVEAPQAVRDRRVAQSRGWGAAQRQIRENLQMPLDKKKELSDYTLDSTADAADFRDQVQSVFTRIVARFESPPHRG
jgi:dephospho-CoA kinase